MLLVSFHLVPAGLLDLKRPRSGIFVNETPRPDDSDIPFETYNPRQLQERIESEGRQKYTLLADGDRYYFPWLKGQENLDDATRSQLEAHALRQDCINFKPVVFPIPSDLHKTFTAAVVFGNEALQLREAGAGVNRPLEIACIYAAYIESFTTNPDYWSAKTLDSIIGTGTELVAKSSRVRYENPKSDFDILPEITEKQSTVEMKLHITGALTDEPNILKSLSLFFDKYNACVLCVESLYFLIWKRCANSFYIYDPNGRDVSCKRDFEEGKASLMAIQTVEHIVHLTLNYSEISNQADFNLYEIHLKDFGKLSKPLQLHEFKASKKLFAVVNRFYAIIPAVSGIAHHGHPGDNNPSMMTSYLALVYSQINPPNHWTMQMVDDLVRFGRKYHNDYSCDNRIKEINIADLPEVVLFGNYRVLVDKLSFARSGHVVECWSYRASQFTLALRDFLSDYSTGLVQVDQSTFALWRDKNMIFVFDPFKRGAAGQAMQSHHGSHKPTAGCLQIHLNVDSLCRILYKNAIVVKNEGNFFLHGIRVKAIGTFSVNQAKEDTARFGMLFIKYPFECDRAKHDEQNLETPDCGDIYKSDPVNCTLVQCLSELSVAPCQRTCSERDFIIQQKKIQFHKKLTEEPSVHSIPAEHRFPEYDDVDVVDSVVGEFICDVMTRIQRKTEKKTKVSIQASKILLQSDWGHLEDLQQRLKRGEDYDNICAAFVTKPPKFNDLTVEQELAMDSNFTELLDGSWAIFGVTNLDSSNEPLKGILATITSAALAAKYNVSTWSSDVIEYALEASGILEERFWSYNHTLDLIFRKQIPKLQLGSSTYQIKVLSTVTVVPERLRTTLDNNLLQVSRLFLICKGLSCMIVRRYNLIYMFMGCPCDVFGFRSKIPGPLCLLRFVDLGALVRRIENACGRCGKYVIVQLEVKTISPPAERFIRRTASQEDLLYGRELSEKERQAQRYRDKNKFLQHELRKEEQRIKNFQKEKLHPQRKQRKLSTAVPTSASGGSGVLDAEEGEIYEGSEDSVEFKHKPGKSVEPLEDEMEFEDDAVTAPQSGYQLRDQDILFKIQGTTALEDHFDAYVDRIKTCYFASCVAILYAILRPLNHWDSRRVDKVVHVAKNVAKATGDLQTASERIIKNIGVDEFTFQVKAQTFTPMGSFGGNLEYKLMKTIQTQRYFMIQISNVTFAVYHDKYFHLFDPYPSMDIAHDQGEEEEEQPVVPALIPMQPEQNTASWVLFGDLTGMLHYIGKRAANPDWKNEYQLHIIQIISYKAAPKRIQLLNLLTEDLLPDPKIPENVNLCTHPEEIEWLDIYPNLVIWSRLNRTNAVQRVRGSLLTKDRNFDIEIPDKLFSLWGSIHPLSAVFGASSGKQHLAINVVACCVATVYQVNEWNTQLIDSIVINGNDYYNDSVSSINRQDYEISLEHLNNSFQMGHLHFNVYLESVTYGYLYARAKNELNLAAALTFFFTNHRYGIVQCMKRSIAIGKVDSGFFMFECQSYGLPLFHSGQGAAYIIRASHLQTLLYCIVMTFNVAYYNAQFTIHKVEMNSEKVESPKD